MRVAQIWHACLVKLLINYCARERAAALRVSQETRKGAEAALHMFSKSKVGRGGTSMTEYLQQDCPGSLFLD